MAAAVPKIEVTDPHAQETSGLASPSQTPASEESVETKNLRPRSRGERIPSAKSTPTKQQQTPSKPSSPPPNQQTPQNGTPSEGKVQAPVAIDPLSQHIFHRTSTQTSLPQKLRTQVESGHLQSQHNPVVPDSDPKHPIGIIHTDSFSSVTKEKDKDKKKGVSFLSRFIGGNKKKGNADGDLEDESEAGDLRPEGMDAQLFSQPVDNIGFNPRHPHPPGYIRVRSKYKKEKEFDRVFLAQELHSSGVTRKRLSTHSNTSTNPSGGRVGGNPIWALEFSKDGKYLAAGGQDKIVRVWAVISSPEERRIHEQEEEKTTNAHLSAPVFQKKTFREYEGHTSTILDLSWSKNNFLLSSSMDKTVRLWHISRSECLCTFKHTDFVPSIQFHPRDDRFFLAGSLDTRLRLWSIPDKSIAYWTQLPDMITAVSFTPDGKTAIAGTLNGLCQFYETEGLKYQTQIHVRSNRGRNTKGSKITGIQTFVAPPDNPNGDIKLLISSNDSRIRLYSFRDKSLEVKFKGHENNYSQIRGSVSDDFKYVICGSEDRRAYIFSTSSSESEKRTQRPYEMFEAHSSITTAAILAPTSTRRLLSNSEDPVYDICNPPPVTLVSRAESIVSSHANTDNGSAAPTPADSTFKRQEESPAYIARSAHYDGHIIVTADFLGTIKVFRQDCAFLKRRSDMWETSSMLSRRMNSIRSGRPLSIATRGSNRSRRDSIGTQPPSDRILSWRQDIVESHSVDNLALRSGQRGKNRSTSPRKSMGASSHASNPRLRHQASSNMSTSDRMPHHNTEIPSITTHPASPVLGSGEHVLHDSPTQIKYKSDTNIPKTNGNAEHNGDESDPLWVQNNQSYAFYNPSLYTPQGKQAPSGREAELLRHPSTSPTNFPELQQKTSVVSALSSEMSSLSGDNDRDGVHGQRSASAERSEGEAEKGEELRCKKCSGTSFRARFVDFGASHRLVCGRCGTEVQDD